jgi:hypothetical protein
MEAIKIIVLCILAACIYGIVHDQVTARVCVEYFTIGHPPILSGTENPTLLGVCWGVIATWWVGLPLGVVLALVSRIGSKAKLRASQLVRFVGLLMLVMGIIALLAGILGYFLAKSGHVWLTGPMASLIPKNRQPLFLADLYAHLASYGSGIIGGLIFCIVVTVWRIKKAKR